MIENEIKEMLKDIIDNGAEYECRHLCGECDNKRKNCDDTCTMTDRLWNKYHLGDEIRSDYEYRKVEIWYVASTDRDKEGHIIFNVVSHQPLLDSNIYAKGTKEECEKWIEEHANKTWLEEILKEKIKSSTEYTRTELDMYELGCEDGIIEVCKKILEEVKIEKNAFNISSDTYVLIQEIIQNLGVEV